MLQLSVEVSIKITLAAQHWSQFYGWDSKESPK